MIAGQNQRPVLGDVIETDDLDLPIEHAHQEAEERAQQSIERHPQDRIYVGSGAAE